MTSSTIGIRVASCRSECAGRNVPVGRALREDASAGPQPERNPGSDGRDRHFRGRMGQVWSSCRRSTERAGGARARDRLAGRARARRRAQSERDDGEGDRVSRFVIRGGRPLSGEIRASGSKNAVLPMIAAALLTDEEVVLENVPFDPGRRRHARDRRRDRRRDLARRRPGHDSRRERGGPSAARRAVRTRAHLPALRRTAPASRRAREAPSARRRRHRPPPPRHAFLRPASARRERRRSGVRVSPSARRPVRRDHLLRRSERYGDRAHPDGRCPREGDDDDPQRRERAARRRSRSPAGRDGRPDRRAADEHADDHRGRASARRDPSRRLRSHRGRLLSRARRGDAAAASRSTTPSAAITG